MMTASPFFSMSFKKNDHLNLKLLLFCRITKCFMVLLSKAQDLGNFELLSMYVYSIALQAPGANTMDHTGL